MRIWKVLLDYVNNYILIINAIHKLQDRLNCSLKNSEFINFLLYISYLCLNIVSGHQIEATVAYQCSKELQKPQLRETHQQHAENNGTTDRLNCNTTKSTTNMHRNGLFDNNTYIPVLVQNISNLPSRR